LLDATSYEVQSSVPVEIFEIFVKALGTDGKVPVTKENAGSMLLLAKEFYLEDLLSEYSALQMASTLSAPVSAPTPVPCVSSSRSINRVNNRLNPLVLRGTSFRGMISYLTGKYDGNVHDKGIVTITSKSVKRDDPTLAPRNVADFTSRSEFCSKRAEQCQWICWNFHRMRLCLSNYTIKCDVLRSWVLETSLYGEVWTKIDRRTDTGKGSFAVSRRVECRFIRLTQTGRNRFGGHELVIRAVEFFGTLRE
jgi:hypothetical protein